MAFNDPITGKMYDYAIESDAQKHLMSVLDLAVKDDCPPDTKDYLCSNPTRQGTESNACARCIMRLAAKVTSSTLGEKRLKQAIQMASNDACPPDKSDWVCKATEDENTDAETCAMCIKRWATIPFGKFKDSEGK